MELQVVTRKDNPLLKRVEVTFKAVHKAEATPTRDAIRSELAKQLKAAKEAVVVARSVSSFGRFETIGYAKVYQSKAEALAVERSHVLVRNRLKEAEAKKKEGEKAEKPAAPPKPAPKAEAKPEAPKPEHKPEPKAEKKAEPKEAKPAAKEEKKPAEKREEKKEGRPEGKKAEPKKKEGK